MSKYGITSVLAVLAILVIGGPAFAVVAGGALIDLQAANNSRSAAVPTEWDSLGTLGGWITSEGDGGWGTGEPALLNDLDLTAYYSTASGVGDGSIGRNSDSLTGNEPDPVDLEDITVEVWSRRVGGAIGGEHQWWGLRSPGHLQRFTARLDTGTNEILMTIKGNTAGQINAHSTGVIMASDGNFHHYVFTYNDTTKDLKLYVDNGAPTTANLAVIDMDPTDTMESLSIFKEFSIEGDSRAFNGDVSLFRVYDKVLSAGEVAGNFAAGPSLIPEPATMALLGIGGLMVLRRRRAA